MFCTACKQQQTTVPTMYLYNMNSQEGACYPKNEFFFELFGQLLIGTFL